MRKDAEEVSKALFHFQRTWNSRLLKTGMSRTTSQIFYSHGVSERNSRHSAKTTISGSTTAYCSKKTRSTVTKPPSCEASGRTFGYGYNFPTSSSSSNQWRHLQQKHMLRNFSLERSSRTDEKLSSMEKPSISNRCTSKPWCCTWYPIWFGWTSESEVNNSYRARLEGIPAWLFTFNVVSQKRWGVQLVRYCGNSFIQLLNKRAKVINARITSPRLNRPRMQLLPKNTDPREAFESVFDIKKFERCDRIGVKTRFGLSILTNGPDASVGLLRKVAVKEVRREILWNCEKLEFIYFQPLQNIKQVAGGDPGGFVTSWECSSETRTSPRSSRASSDRRKNTTTKLASQSSTDRHERDFLLKPIDDDMKGFNDKFKAYSKPKYLHFRFQHHVRSHKADDRFVSRVIGHKKNTEFSTETVGLDQQRSKGQFQRKKTLKISTYLFLLVSATSRHHSTICTTA